MLLSVVAITEEAKSLDKPCFTEIVVTGSSRNRSSPPEVETQILPSRSSKRPAMMSPDRPSDFLNTSVRPIYTWTSPPLVGSDPETTISIPKQFIRIDFTVRHRRIRIDCAANRVRFDFVADELPESGAPHAN